MWDTLPTNKKVGTLYADNDGGRAMSHPQFGFPPAFMAAGYDVIDASLFRMDTDDFSTQIAAFKDAGVEIIAGHAFENHLATFWNQAIQVGFTPKICTIAAGLLFPPLSTISATAATACQPRSGGRRPFPIRRRGLPCLRRGPLHHRPDDRRRWRHLRPHSGFARLSEMIAG
jgi:hypothetical protein